MSLDLQTPLNVSEVLYITVALTMGSIIATQAGLESETTVLIVEINTAEAKSTIFDGVKHDLDQMEHEQNV